MYVVVFVFDGFDELLEGLGWGSVVAGPEPGGIL
jgi:hypothetical protein